MTMADLTIFHNPACGTSRNVLALIRHAGIEPQVIEYLKTPPSRDEIRALAAATGEPLRALLREKEAVFTELGLADPTLSDDALLDAIAQHPILLNRPIVVSPLGTALCRPSEAVLPLLPVGPLPPFTKIDGEVVIDSGERRTGGGPLRRLRYNVACSLDGFIADPHGGYDWIVEDTSIDFDALYAEFDTFVMGRKTWAVMQAMGDANPLRGRRVVVVSRTLADWDGVTVLREGIEAAVAALKAEALARDIWLFGGSELAGALFEAGLVDRVETAVMPVLLTRGIPLLPAGAQHRLALASAKSLASGIQMLAYDVVR